MVVARSCYSGYVSDQRSKAPIYRLPRKGFGPGNHNVPIGKGMLLVYKDGWGVMTIRAIVAILELHFPKSIARVRVKVILERDASSKIAIGDEIWVKRKTLSPLPRAS